MVGSLLEIITERGSQVLQASGCFILANVIDEIEVSMVLLVVTFFVGS